MSIGLVPTYADRHLYAPTEKNDCTVRATSHALEIPYGAAHLLLKFAGRKDRHRTNVLDKVLPHKLSAN